MEALEVPAAVAKPELEEVVLLSHIYEGVPPLVLAVNVPDVDPEQMTLLVGDIVLVNVQFKVVPEHGPTLQSLSVPKIVDPPLEVIDPVASIVPVPATVTLPVAQSKSPFTISAPLTVNVPELFLLIRSPLITSVPPARIFIFKFPLLFNRVEPKIRVPEIFIVPLSN